VISEYTHGKYEKSCKKIPEPKPHPMIVLKFTSRGNEKNEKEFK
jgi:hypothetical protein